MMRFALPFAVLLGVALALPLPAATGFGPAAAVAKAKAKTRLAKAKDPETVIRTIYSQYSREAGPAEAEQQNFSPDLLKLWYEVQGAASTADQIGVDFDVFLDAQELDAVSNVATKFTPGWSWTSRGGRATGTGSAMVRRTRTTMIITTTHSSTMVRARQP